ncbi:MAG: hypothetical protein ACRD4L_01355, partial [Pyrinomonadaceae bacterium]
DLAGDHDKRKLFVDNPAGYLTARSLPVPECRLVSADMSMTSEVCTANAICNLNFFANVNAVTKVNAGLAINALTIANVANAVNTFNYGYGAVLYSDESIMLAKSLGSFNNQVL